MFAKFFKFFKGYLPMLTRDCDVLLPLAPL